MSEIPENDNLPAQETPATAPSNPQSLPPPSEPIPALPASGL